MDLDSLNDKIYQLMFQKLFSLSVDDQEADIVAFNRFPTKDDEVFGTLCKKASELRSGDCESDISKCS